jgi:hypothetical protein
MYYHGPAIISRLGKYYYFRDGIKAPLKSATGKVNDALKGDEIDEYLKHRSYEISGTPTGMIRNFSDLFPHSLEEIGDSIFHDNIVSTLASATVANPTVVTSAVPHGLVSGQSVTIAGTTNGTAELNGTHVATVTSRTTFTVPVNVSDAPDASTGTITPLPIPLDIYTKAGLKISFPRSGVTKAPTLLLGIGDIFDDAMQWRCMGEPVEAYTESGHFRTLTEAALPVGDFDETVIRRYRYTAALGAEASPYDAIRAQTGFRLSVGYGVEEIMDDNFGLADLALKSITAGVKFIPSNLSQAQIDTLLKLNGSGALVPGESIAKGSNALVIEGEDADGGFSATLHKCGFSDADTSFEIGKLNAGEIVAVTRRTFTAGASDPLVTFTVT